MVAHYNKSKFYMPRDLLKRFDDLYNINDAGQV